MAVAFLEGWVRGYLVVNLRGGSRLFQDHYWGGGVGRTARGKNFLGVFERKYRGRLDALPGEKNF